MPGSGSSQSKEPQKVAYLAYLRTSKGTLTWSSVSKTKSCTSGVTVGLESGEGRIT